VGIALVGWEVTMGVLAGRAHPLEETALPSLTRPPPKR
jgi:hypothetical protein